MGDLILIPKSFQSFEYRDIFCHVSILFILAFVGVAHGQVPLEELLQCRDQENDQQRLACFDRQSARLAPSSESVKSTPRALVPSPSLDTPEQRFGFRGEVAREKIDRERLAEPTLEKLEAKVTALRFGPAGYWVVTLDNGQEWAQLETGARLRIRVGEAVTIVPMVLGSFSLYTETGRSTRVRRRL